MKKKHGNTGRKRPDLAERNRSRRDERKRELRGTYWNMRARCENPCSKDYERYGARGVRVCDQWKTLDGFVADMYPRPRGTQLDRIDNDGDYSPENCRWVSPKRNARNKRTNVRLTAFGRTQCVAAWAEESGIGKATIRHRIKVGWLVEDAVSVPPGGSRGV